MSRNHKRLQDLDKVVAVFLATCRDPKPDSICDISCSKASKTPMQRTNLPDFMKAQLLQRRSRPFFKESSYSLITAKYNTKLNECRNQLCDVIKVTQTHGTGKPEIGTPKFENAQRTADRNIFQGHVGQLNHAPEIKST